MSLYDRVEKGHFSRVHFHSRSQGLEGVFGLSGVEDFREKEKQRDRRGENRWVEMGRMAGRQTAEEFKK